MKPQDIIWNFLQLEEAPGDKKDGTKAETEAPQPKKIPKEADFLIYTCAKEIGNLKKNHLFPHT